MREKFSELMTDFRKRICEFLGIGSLSGFQEKRLSEILASKKNCSLIERYKLVDAELIKAGKKLLEIVDEDELVGGKILVARIFLKKSTQTDLKRKVVRERLANAKKEKEEIQKRLDLAVDEFYKSIMKRSAELGFE